MIHRISFFLCALLLCVSSPASGETITLVGDAWCPYNCQRGLENQGYVVDLAREIFNKAGIRVRYEVVSWQRALKEVEAGRVTGVIGVERREAEQLVFPEEPVGASAFAFYVRKDDPWIYTGLPSLEGKRIGLPISYGLEPDMRDYFKRRWWKIHIQYVGGQFPARLNVEKLVADRVDVILDDINVIKNTARSLKVENRVRMAGSDNKYTRIYIAFSPALSRAGKLAAILSRGIREMRRSGRLQSILDKYGLEDWQGLPE